jgi:hypothetical protein
VHFNRRGGSQNHVWICCACGAQLSGPKLPDDEREAFIQFVGLLDQQLANSPQRKEEKMKLEVAMLVGPETKQFLADLTKQLDRMEALKGGAAPADTPAPAKTGKGKGKAAPAEEPADTGLGEEAADGAEASEADDLFGDDAAAEDAEPTLDEVRKIVKDFATKHGKEKALKLLGKFKVTAINDLKKADYSKVIELAKKHL